MTGKSMFQKTESALPWFSKCLLDKTVEMGEFLQTKLVYDIAYGLETQPLDPGMEKYYLFNPDESWFCPIFTTVEIGQMYTTGRAQIIPVVRLIYFEGTYDSILEWFVRPDIPWDQFGLEYTPTGWRQLVVDNPTERQEITFCEWVSKHIRGNYRSRVYGCRSNELQWDVVTKPEVVVETFYQLLPSLTSYWCQKANSSSLVGIDDGLPQAVSGESLFADATYPKLYFYHSFLPELTRGCAFAVRYSDGRNPVGMLMCRYARAARCYNVYTDNGSEYRPGIVATELVVTNKSEKYRSFGLVPMLFLRMFEYVFWKLHMPAVALGTSFDTRLDKYKMAFRPRVVDVPGLRMKGVV